MISNEVDVYDANLWAKQSPIVYLAFGMLWALARKFQLPHNYQEPVIFSTSINVDLGYARFSEWQGI